MGTEVRGWLVSDYKSWDLGFEAPKKTSRVNSSSVLGRTVSVVVCLVAWPVLFLAGSFVFSGSSFIYLKSAWNQRRIVSILGDENKLREFGAKRAECCERQIKNLKADAILIMEKCLENPDELNLSMPSKKTFLDRFTPLLPDEYWNDFSWDAFLRTDFLEKSNVPENPDKKALLDLEEIRTKINFLNQQKDLFSQGNTKLEHIQAVAQMSFIKNGIRRQYSKEWAIRSFCWAFPLGIMADFYFRGSANDRLTYENNKSFLPSGVGLDSYKDLIEAHNQLLAANPFLVPYIRRVISAEME